MVTSAVERSASAAPSTSRNGPTMLAVVRVRGAIDMLLSFRRHERLMRLTGEQLKISSCDPASRARLDPERFAAGDYSAVATVERSGGAMFAAFGTDGPGGEDGFLAHARRGRIDAGGQARQQCGHLAGARQRPIARAIERRVQEYRGDMAGRVGEIGARDPGARHHGPAFDGAGVK